MSILPQFGPGEQDHRDSWLLVKKSIIKHQMTNDKLALLQVLETLGGGVMTSSQWRAHQWRGTGPFWSHKVLIFLLNANFHYRTSTSSQSEIKSLNISGPVHPSKEKYSDHSNSKYSLSGQADQHILPKWNSLPKSATIATIIARKCKIWWLSILQILPMTLYWRDTGSTEKCNQATKENTVWGKPSDQYEAHSS